MPIISDDSRSWNPPPSYKHETKHLMYLRAQFEFYIQQAKCRKLSRTSLSPHKRKVNAREIQLLFYKTHRGESIIFNLNSFSLVKTILFNILYWNSLILVFIRWQNLLSFLKALQRSFDETLDKSVSELSILRFILSPWCEQGCFVPVSYTHLTLPTNREV